MALLVTSSLGELYSHNMLPKMRTACKNFVREAKLLLAPLRLGVCSVFCRNSDALPLIKINPETPIKTDPMKELNLESMQ